jgi:hypothetical protein
MHKNRPLKFVQFSDIAILNGICYNIVTAKENNKRRAKTMMLTKGTMLKKSRNYTDTMFAGTCSNWTEVWKVKRVNKNSYTLVCVEGHMENCEVKLSKDFKEFSRDEYGTETKWEIIETA